MNIMQKTGNGDAIFASDSRKSFIYCSLLALQFGLQPMIASRFTNSDVSKSTIVMATEIGKIGIAAIAIASEPSAVQQKIFSSWNIKSSITKAALPAILYAIQNVMVSTAYDLNFVAKKWFHLRFNMLMSYSIL
jgi:hypothetical protein